MSVGRAVRRAVLAAVVAALAAGIARAIGVDAAHTLVIGWGVLALAVVGAIGAVEAPDPSMPLETEPVTGGRRDVEQLAWSLLENRTHVRGVVLARIQRIAAVRLAEHGLRLQRPEDARAIEALLGPTAWEVVRPGRTRHVLPRALDAALQAIEHLEPPSPLAATPASDPNRTTRAD